MFVYCYIFTSRETNPCARRDTSTFTVRSSQKLLIKSSKRVRKTAATTMTTRLERIRAIGKATKNAFPDGWIQEAVRLNKDRQFIAIGQTILKKMKLVPENETFENNEQLDLLSWVDRHVKTFVVDNALYSFKIMCRSHHSYVLMPKQIEYGNCSHCYKALPLGLFCPACLLNVPARSCRVYCVRDRHMWQAPNKGQWDDFTHDRLKQNGLRQADPFDLSVKIMGVAPHLSLNAATYEAADSIYQEEEQHLYCVLDIEFIVHQLHARGNFENLFPKLEESLQKITWAHPEDIQRTVDQHIRYGHFVDYQVAMIRSNRLRDGTLLEEMHADFDAANQAHVPPIQDMAIRPEYDSDSELFY